VSDCLFCRIASGEIQTGLLHSSENVLAFRDINPQAPTHILLIPRQHVPSVRELVPEQAPMVSELLAAAAQLARDEGIDESGWRLVTNVGDDAGQSVPHLHFHLLGGRPMAWPPG
jgi:histidine triad (HIT) family protein